ncbi:MAG TPA: glycosyltransferase, partial [Candidatus Polarisedimenticolaceae bacterium]|nr:glycosyltransferase [Candidatus Polarisedimenticolaceae bacterium]
RVDRFIANSNYVRQRIAKYYRRESVVINPPIDVGRFTVGYGPRSGFVVVSRLIPYKRVDLAVQACTKLNLPLTIIGDGSELAKLQAMAGPSVHFAGRLSDAEIADELGRAQAFIFTADDDFGLTPLEAMACGTPVIALGKGGATETVVKGTTGSWFLEQTPESLGEVLQKFNSEDYDPAKIRNHAERYDQSVFIKKIHKYVIDQMETYKKG